MSKVLSTEAAMELLGLTQHFQATTPHQYNRAHLRTLIATSLTTGAKNAEYFQQFGLDRGDLSSVMRGKPVEIIDDRARQTMVLEIENTARRALGWDERAIK